MAESASPLLEDSRLLTRDGLTLDKVLTLPRGELRAGVLLAHGISVDLDEGGGSEGSQPWSATHPVG